MAALPASLLADMSEQQQMDVAKELSMKAYDVGSADALQRAQRASLESEDARAMRSAWRKLAAAEEIMTQRVLLASINSTEGANEERQMQQQQQLQRNVSIDEQAEPMDHGSSWVRSKQKKECGRGDDELVVDEAATAAAASAGKRQKKPVDIAAGSPRARAIEAAEARKEQRGFERLESQRRMRNRRG